MNVFKIIGVALVLFASPAMAKDNGPSRWTVTQRSGDVRVIRNGLQPASLEVRAALTPGDVVATGATGRAVLVRGEDYVVVAPGSRLLLPKEETSGFTRLLQQVGTMLYKVRHTGVPHFEVKTPLLAAVVKGTSFTVVVDDKRAAVQVTDGIVEVSSNDGSARRLVEKGVTVFVGQERPGAIVTVRPDTKIEAAPSKESVKVESSGEVTVAAIADLSAGLVTATTVAPTSETDAKPVAGLTVATVIDTKDLSNTKSDALGTPTVEATDVTKPVVKAPLAPVVDIVTTNPVTTPPAAVVDTVTTTPVVTTPVTLVETVLTTPVLKTPITTTLPVVTIPITTTVPVVTTPVTTIVPVVTTPVTTTVPVITAPVAPIVTAPIVPVTTVVTIPVSIGL